MESLELNNFLGLGAGCIILFFVWISGSKRCSTMQRDIENLKNEAATQQRHTAQGNALILKENEDLKERNENLRVTVKTWQMKPGRADWKNLYVLEKAARIMTRSALGTAWEMAIVEAEKEIEDTDTGKAALIFRKIRSMLPQGNDLGDSDRRQ